MKHYSFLEERDNITGLLGRGVNRRLIRDNHLKDFPTLIQKKRFVRGLSDGIKAGKWDKIQKKASLMDLVKSQARLPFNTHMDWSKI